MAGENHTEDRVAGGFRASRFLTGLIFALLVAIALFILPRVKLIPFEADHWTADWRTALLSERAPRQHNRIAVVLINYDTLADYPYISPIDRALLAKIIAVLDQNGVKSIGLDILIDQPTEPDKDRILIDQIRNTRAEIILARASESSLTPRQRKYQEQFAKDVDRPAGHVHFVLKRDLLTIDHQTVRTIPPPQDGYPGFAHRVAQTMGTVTDPASDRILWQRRPADGTELFLTLPAHVLLQLAKTPDSAASKAVLGQLEGRAILVGGGFSDLDRHPTPLSVVNEARTLGVLIHAQILAQLIDGRSYRLLDKLTELAMLASIAMVATLLGWRYRLKKLGVIVGAFGAAAVIAADFFVFSQFGIILPFTTHWLAWVGGVTGGHYLASLFRFVNKA